MRFFYKPLTFEDIAEHVEKGLTKQEISKLEKVSSKDIDDIIAFEYSSFAKMRSDLYLFKKEYDLLKKYKERAITKKEYNKFKNTANKWGYTLKRLEETNIKDIVKESNLLNNYMFLAINTRIFIKIISKL